MKIFIGIITYIVVVVLGLLLFHGSKDGRDE